MKSFLLSLSIILISLSAFGQKTFDEFIQDAQQHANEGTYGKAVGAYISAITAEEGRARLNEVLDYLTDLTTLIERQGIESEQNLKLAKKRFEEASQLTERLKASLDTINLQSNKLELSNEANKELINELEEIQQVLEQNNIKLEQQGEIIQSRNVAAKLKELDVSQTKQKAQIALQCYQLNKNNAQGDTQHNDIFEALFEAHHEMQANHFDTYSLEVEQGNNPVRDLHIVNNRLYACTSAGELSVWEINGNLLKKQVSIINQESAIRALVPDVNSSNLLLVSPFHHSTFDLQTNQLSKQSPVNTGVTHAAFINQRYLFASSNNIYEISQTTPILSANFSIAHLFDWDGQIGMLSENGQAYLSSSNGIIELDQLHAYGKHKGRISILQTFKNEQGLHLSYGTKNGSIIIETADKRIEQKIHDSRVKDIQFSPSGKWLATTAYDGSVSIWEIAKLNTPYYEPFILDNFDAWVLSVVFNSDENGLFLGIRDGKIRYIDLNASYYADRLCNSLGDVELSSILWQSYFGEKIEQPQSCK